MTGRWPRWARVAASAFAVLALAAVAFPGDTIDVDREPASTWLRENWFELRIGDAKVGWMRRALVRTTWDERPAVAREAEIHVNVAGDGNAYDSFARTVFELEGDQRLVSVTSRVTSQARASAREVRLEDGAFVVRTRSDGRDVDGAVPAVPVFLSDELALERLVTEWLATEAPRDEVSLGARGLDVDHLRLTAQKLRVRQDEQTGVPDGQVAVRTGDGKERWSEPLTADATGIVRGSLFAGIDVHRSTEERARAAADLVSVVTASRVPLDGEVGDPSTARRVVLVAEGPAAAALETVGRQTVEDLPDGRRRIVIERDRKPAPVMLLDLAPARARTPLIDFEDRDLTRALNAELRGISLDAHKVNRLLGFVQRTVEYTVVLGDVSASDTLRRRRGDCSESARLFVALCRGAKIPARLVHGLIWTERGGGGLAPHAWAEVALEDHWREVDPVSGSLPAHPVRIRLDPERTDLRTLRGLSLRVESIDR